MKKETKELVRTLGIALVVMMVVPLVYRVCIYFWPPEEKPHPTLTQFLKEAESAHCIKLLTKPISKWSDEEAKLELEIYLWLKDQGNEILPWAWTEEARRMGMGHKGQERQEGGRGGWGWVTKGRRGRRGRRGGWGWATKVRRGRRGRRGG